MIKNLIIFLRYFYCMNLNKHINEQKQEINHIISNDTFLRNFSPTFASMDKHLFNDDTINHYQSILELIMNDNLIYNVSRELEMNNIVFINNVDEILKIIKKLKINFNESFDQTILNQQIETILINAFYQELNQLINFVKSNKTKKEIYDAKITFINKMQRQIHNKRSSIIRQFNLKSEYCTKTFTIFKELHCFLKEIKYKIEKKVFMNDALFKPCTQFFKKKDKVQKIEVEDNSTQNTLKSIENKNIIALEKLNSLKKILSNTFECDSKNFDIEIENIIYNVYNLLYFVFQNDSLELDLDHFIMIYMYFNFLLKQCYIILFNMEKTLKSENEFDSNFDFQKYNNVVSFLKNEKLLIYILIQNALEKYYTFVVYLKTFSDDKNLKNCYENYLSIDILYDKFLDFIISKQNNIHIFKEISEEFEQTITSYKTNGCFSDLFGNNYVHFKIHCNFFFRLVPICFFFKNNFVKSSTKYVEDLTNRHFHFLNNILKLLKKKQEKDIAKIQFLETVIEKNNDNLILINNLNINESGNINYEDIKLFVEKEFAFDLNLRNITKKMITNNNTS
ncbi:hypothetical protein NUSPORA_02131 [Nucleospora cyclopteri]